jgi:hypothetical protein
MLSKSELAQQGIELANQLNELQNRYHEKSDANDVLYYEALNLRAKVRDLLEGCGLTEDRTQSAMLSVWGSALVVALPDIADRVRQFNAEYDRCQCGSDYISARGRLQNSEASSMISPKGYYG